MTRPYVVEDGVPGRPKTEIDPKAPEWFRLHDELMEKLDVRGWYRELGERKRREETDGDPPDDDLQHVTDPEEIDRLMCRTEPVAECKTPEDLEIARFNNRIVVEIDLEAPNDLLFPKIAALLEGPRRALFEELKRRPARHINTDPWNEHRILALYDLKLHGYDLSKGRKQLAAWLFPEIADEKKRGDRFDRAKEHLETAVAHLSGLRAQSTG